MNLDKIALIGNPNVGKTTLFNLLTGKKQRTGNWPGVTVDHKEGEFVFLDQQFLVVDLPGIYSINDKELSIDEKITKDFVANNPDYLYFNIINGTTLERDLYLTTQLRELGVNVIIIISMMDIVDKRDIEIDVDVIKNEFSCEVIPLSFKSHIDLTIFIDAINNYQTLDKFDINYSIDTIDKSDSTDDIKDINLLKANAMFNKSSAIAKSVVKNSLNIKTTISDKIDSWVLGSWSGILIFFTVIYLLFLFSINFGGALIDFFDILAGVIFVDGITYLLTSLSLPQFMIIVIADGIGKGIQVVATFVPIIAFLYLFLTLLEEIGYMARAAFVMDKFMRRIGLSGKSFIPLIIGFGCNVPSIMATRTLDSNRERITTVMMSPFMSCGARLTVYALFAAVFFTQNGQNIVFLLYVIGVVFAIFTGLILKRVFKNSATSDFLMELPSYQLPSLRNLVNNTWNKLKSFVLGAGKIIIVVVTIINVINSIGVDGSFNNQNSKNSILSVLAQKITPVFSPLGIEKDNWPATVGILTGILAKEVVVGTLDSLYSNIDLIDGDNKPSGANEYNLLDGFNEALATIPVNIITAFDNVLDPLGLSILDDISSQNLAAQSQEVSVTTFKAMALRFDGKSGAFAYLLFILLYFPCVSALGAMANEVGRRWALIGALWSTSLAYAASIIFYQSSTLLQHPLSSILWIVLSIILLIAIIITLIKAGKKISNTTIPLTNIS